MTSTLHTGEIAVQVMLSFVYLTPLLLRIREFPGFERFCGGIVFLSSAFCDSGGYCTFTGMARWKADYRKVLYESSLLVTEAGERIAFESAYVKAAGESHGREYDAIRLRFRIDPVQAKDVFAFQVVCDATHQKEPEDSKQIRVYYRERNLNDHIVVCISQFYR